MSISRRVVATAVTWLAAQVLVTAATALVVLFLAGPHAGLLPQWLEAVVLGLGWITVIAAPVLIARRAWLRLAPAGEPPPR